MPLRDHCAALVADVFADLAGPGGFGLMGPLARGARGPMQSLGTAATARSAASWLVGGAAASAGALLAELRGSEAWPSRGSRRGLRTPCSAQLRDLRRQERWRLLRCALNRGGKRRPDGTGRRARSQLSSSFSPSSQARWARAAAVPVGRLTSTRVCLLAGLPRLGRRRSLMERSSRLRGLGERPDSSLSDTRRWTIPRRWPGLGIRRGPRPTLARPHRTPTRCTTSASTTPVRARSRSRS